MITTPIETTRLETLKLLRRGKVRDVYDLGSRLLLVASDRISAFDHVLATPIPGKGRTLTELSAFWFGKTRDIAPNHYVTSSWPGIRKALEGDLLPQEFLLDGPDSWKDRSMLVAKAERIDIECVVRGYLAGSAYKEYEKTGAVCGIQLPKGLREAEKLPRPIFTPATKADVGHDENISWERCVELVGEETASRLKAYSLSLYDFGSKHLAGRGLLLADTKFEFGSVGGELLVIDEMLTPDSSRFWDERRYQVGWTPESFDKQYVRDHLDRIGWDRNPPAPGLPSEVVRGTVRRYREALERITS